MEAPIQTPKAGPVAAYSFDEGEGTTVEDVTGGGHEGTIEAPAAWAKGKYGGAVEFDGDGGGCVSVPDSAALGLGEEFTIEAWVKSKYLGNEPVVYKEDEGSTSYALGIGLDEFSKAEAWVDGEGGQWEAVSSDPVEPHVWTHLAVTYDGAHLRLYVDGEEVATKAAPGLDLTSEGPLRIGCAPPLGDTFYGRIDEVRLYQRALNAGEVVSDMEAPLQTPKQGPVAAWSFDEGEGTTAEDLTGDGHTATLHGATWTTRGRYGGAMEFDAAEESHLSVPDSPELDLTEEFTLEAWVRPESESNEWAPIIAKEMGGGEAAEELAYWLYEGDWNPNEPFGGTEPEPGEEDQAESDDPLPVDAWSHVALTWDGSKVRLYVDGELVDCSPVVPAGAPPVTEGELQIGGATELGDYFTGRIDEARVYNRRLSEAEIKASMKPLPEVGTAEPYDLEDTEGVMAATVNPHGQEMTYKFQYGPTKQYGTVVPEEPEEVFGGTKPLEVEEVAEELQPETTYHYRVVATSEAGTVVGPDQTLITGPETVTPHTLEAHPLAEGKWKGFFNLAWSGKAYETAEELKMVEKSGAEMFRRPIEEPSPEMNDIFRLAAKRHITVLPQIVADAVPGGGHQMEPQDEAGLRPAWRAKVREVVERYGHGGSFWEISQPELPKMVPEYWEIWNEENYGANGNESGEVDPNEYGDLLAEAREVITDVDPQAKILLGGLLSVSKKPGEVDHETIGEFIRRLGEAGYSDAYDAVSLHPYAFKGSVKRISRQVMRNIHKARAALKRAGVGGKEIWVTEIGWPVGNPNDDKETPEHPHPDNDRHHIPVSQEKQKELLESVFRRSKERSGTGPHGLGIEKVFYYNVQDNFYGEPKDWSTLCGLREDVAKVNKGGEEPETPEHGKYRKAWYAFQREAEFEGTFP